MKWVCVLLSVPSSYLKKKTEEKINILKLATSVSTAKKKEQVMKPIPN